MEVFGGLQTSSSVDVLEYWEQSLVWRGCRSKIKSGFVVSASTYLRSSRYCTRGLLFAKSQLTSFEAHNLSANERKDTCLVRSESLPALDHEI